MSNAIRTGPRVRAPEFVAGDWFGTDEPLTLRGLRGRFVLLDFWTSCCGNCLHVLDELRAFERDHADVATVVGVHSPKFPHEAEPAVVAAAVDRYEVHHPVLNDPGLQLWRQYAVRAWPTLVLIDPEGYVVAQAAGEGQVSALAAVVDRLAAEHEARGTLRRQGLDAAPAPAPTTTDLRYPAKAIALPGGTLLVADAGHHQIVELAADGQTVLRRIGSGVRGQPFSEPNGLALLPDGIAPYDLLVADTANHVLRGVRLADGEVVATIDLPALLADELTVTGPIPLALSPWDVAWWPAAQRAVVAAAGVHLLLAFDPATNTAEVLAGTTVEGLRDGPALDAWLAQPSGLAVDGERVWFADSETSALRWLDIGGMVHTAVGEGLFDFGHVDGPAADARLQHPLGVAVLADGSVGLADTYNGAVRRYDPDTEEVTTLASGLDEPSGLLALDDRLLVVESSAHRLTAVGIDADVAAGSPGVALRTERPPVDLVAGEVTLDVPFTPAPGRKLDDRYGPSTRLSVTASPPELLRAGAGDSTDLHRRLDVSPGEGVLHVTAQAASCDDSDALAGEHPACYLARQDWGVPVRVGADGTAQLTLPLLG